MCGILGSLPAAGLRMDWLAHRGPDGRGAAVLPEVAFGHTRLAILDLSDRAAQPKWSRDGNVLLTYNGEIYNLPGPRHRRRAFRHRGPGRVAGPRGPGLRCRPAGRHVRLCRLVRPGAAAGPLRDPAGIKPLYVALGRGRRGHGLRLGDQGLLRRRVVPARSPTLDEAVQREFLQNGCGSRGRWPSHFGGSRPSCTLVPTLMAGVYQFCPGQTLTFPMDAPPRQRRTVLGRPQASDVFEALDETVREQSMADVEVGVQLSGGIDSSLVAYHYAQRHAAVHGFFVSVDWRRLSEAPWAEIARERLSKVCPVPLPPDPGHRGRGRPRPARGHVVHGRAAHPVPQRRGPVPPVRVRPRQKTRSRSCSAAKGPMRSSADTPGRTAGRPPASRPPGGCSTWACPSPAIAPAPAARRGGAWPGGVWHAGLRRPDAAVLDWQLQCDRQTYLPPILHRQDRMSMAHGIETRVPFLANRFLRMPPPAARGKRVLKRRAAELFGRRFAWRKKVGFSFPFAWMGGAAGIRPEHLGWLRGSWQPQDPGRRGRSRASQPGREYYLFGGWKNMAGGGRAAKSKV